MVRKLALLGVMVWSLQGQRSDTIYQQLSANVTASPYTSSPVTNIGQSAHNVVLIISASGGTCSTVISAQLQFSYDKIHYTPFGGLQKNSSLANTVTTGNTAYQIYSGSGAYPYVNFTVSDLSVSAHCTIQAMYSGALASNGVAANGLTPDGAIALSSTNNNFSSPPVILGGVISGNNVSHASLCSTSTFASIAAGSASIKSFIPVPAGPFSFSKVGICGFVATSTATATIQFSTSDSGTCPGSNISPAFNISATSPLVVPAGLVPSISAVVASSVQTLCATVTGGTVNLNFSPTIETWVGQ